MATHLLFSRRKSIANQIERFMKEKNIAINVFNVITVLDMFDGLKQTKKELSNKPFQADKQA